MATTRTARTAVVVTSHPERDALNIVMDSPDIDVAIFESPANAYTRIKREQPAVVIVSLSFDSATEFLLLTMLKLDRETASIPVWTCADLRETQHIELLDLGQAGASCCSSNYFQRS
jgi:PleD family two-component response regulator